MLGLVATVSLAACAFLIAVLIREGLAQAGLWAGPLGALAAIVAAAAAVWALAPRASMVPLPPEPDVPLPPELNVPAPPESQVPDWVVGRPAELDAVVQALLDGQAGP